jgi:histidinol-phosphate aminotransferase
LSSISPLSAFNRRSFLRFAAVATAGAAVPIIGESHLALAQRSKFKKTLPAPDGSAVMIDANENPLGPCTAARSAIVDLVPKGGRYEMPLTDKLVATIAAKESLKPENIAVYAGSSEPLHFTVLAFTSKERGLVAADPGYEAGAYAAKLNEARVTPVPLTKTYAHDVRAMVTADPKAGVLYICNPNNPTGTVTSREDIEYALKNKPSGSILLIDEAYIHFTDLTPTMDMVRNGEEVIVLRTFSKIYGMAGVRCGFAAGRPDLLARLKLYGQNSLSIFALAAATTSLEDPNVIPERKEFTGRLRSETLEWLTKQGYTVTTSQSNCFMVDTRKPSHDVILAMAKKDVFIGRPWPSWNTWVRVTVGTQNDMAMFQKTFASVMNA